MNDMFYILDELNSPLELTGTDGGLVQRYAFDEYGNELSTRSRAHADARHKYSVDGNIIQPFAFTGYIKDAVAGADYAQARYYNSDTGRFIARDREEFISFYSPKTTNLYNYCNGNPVSFIDPTGNYTKEEGIEAHVLLQAYALGKYNFGEGVQINGETCKAFVEVPIPGASSAANGNMGFADLALVYGDTAEVYEIKSSYCEDSYVQVPNPEGGGKIFLKDRVTQQLYRYIEKFTGTKAISGVKNVEPGTSFELPLLLANPYTGDIISYYSIPGNPGIIYYFYLLEDDRELVREEATVVNKEYMSLVSKKYTSEVLSYFDYESELDSEILRASRGFDFNFNFTNEYATMPFNGVVLAAFMAFLTVVAFASGFGEAFTACGLLFLLLSSLISNNDDCGA